MAMIWIPLMLSQLSFSEYPTVFLPQGIVRWKSCVLLPEPLLTFEDYAQDLCIWLLIQSVWQLFSLKAHLLIANCLLLAVLTQDWFLFVILAHGMLMITPLPWFFLMWTYFLSLASMFLVAINFLFGNAKICEGHIAFLLMTIVHAWLAVTFHQYTKPVKFGCKIRPKCDCSVYSRTILYYHATICFHHKTLSPTFYSEIIINCFNYVTIKWNEIAQKLFL